MFKISVKQAKSITMEMPEKLAQMALREKPQQSKSKAVTPLPKENVLRTLIWREFSVNNVQISNNTKIVDNTLYLDGALAQQALSINPLVKKVTIDVIKPGQHDVFTNTIMDIMPIATKVEGKMGEGITHCLRGVVVFLTGIDEAGRQIAEFGSSHGILKDKVAFGMPGTPKIDEIVLRIDVVIEKGAGMERRGPLAAHQVCDWILDHIRRELKKMPPQEAVFTQEFKDIRREGRPKVLIVKELGGQGAMHEKIIMPSEPGGVRGGKSIIDLGNVPVILTPNEVKDGGIHSMT
ncbi:glycine/sarcosine/betaine reductase component B subunit [Thermosediminibacter oceani]|uniref:D-proline reductase (Dithiol) n=1 Tax=Thermosediminibacter oceani (strain ATCC BAA-1034 / DSM 16646 / JW/IW-1228P) TaxID=555079 RepID=D9RYJ1_THEOJ|nr:glycine/sarcosine/betaine reductase component B subunit [Thermosediminibacter oceani]ADL08415.1 D-proline reductase (dithiol) [Thermosediminibacter oceani DSM 16646]